MVNVLYITSPIGSLWSVYSKCFTLLLFMVIESKIRHLGSLWSLYSILGHQLVVYGHCTLYALPHGCL